MREIYIDGNEILDENAFYDILQEKLKLPDYFGRNLDALWESIADEEIELPIIIEVVNSSKIQENLGDNFFNNIMSIFKDAQDELGKEKFRFEIK
ncbi:MAG: barstar family protein [Spirochaetes bacterium]|nr:barstar family protein [Spirochaetota bacterium]